MCKSSKGELKILKFLKTHNIEYIAQKRFDDCKFKQPLPFDFYLPDYNMCIEYDGELHFKEVDYFGGKEQLNLQQKHDNIKNKYCQENNIKLLRIPYWDFNDIDEILDKEIPRNEINQRTIRRS